MKKALLITCLAVSSVCAYAQMTTRVVRDSLSIPWELVYGPDDHIWFTQKNGYICRLEPVSGHIDTVHHETESEAQGEGGMLGLALHPFFSTTPHVYVAYNYDNGGNYEEKVVRYTYSGGSFSSPTTMVDGIDAAGIHNGCRLLVVGDKLFITTGDAANQPSAQNINSLNGKVLRINLDGTIPADNPIAGSRLWSWGHRNAQGLTYANGKMYSSEHGPSSDDEVNIIEKGRNYGWPTVKGFCDQSSETAFCTDSNVMEPLMAWTPTIAVCGMIYYNHPMLPAWENSLLMTTLKDETLYRLELNGSYDSIINADLFYDGQFGRLRAICTAPNGKVYLSTSNTGFTNKIVEIYDPSYTNVPGFGKNSELTIFPNPTGDYTVISLPEDLMPAKLQYIVADAQGRTVMTGEIQGNNTTLSTRQLAKGTYQVKITTKLGRVFTGKILKQ